MPTRGLILSIAVGTLHDMPTDMVAAGCSGPLAITKHVRLYSLLPRIVAGRYTIRVYTDDHGPAHVHVMCGGAELRVYLEGNRPPERLAGRMTATETRGALAVVRERYPELLALWKRYHA